MIGLSSAFTFACTAVVAARIYTRAVLLHTFGVDDVFILITQVRDSYHARFSRHRCRSWTVRADNITDHGHRVECINYTRYAIIVSSDSTPVELILVYHRGTLRRWKALMARKSGGCHSSASVPFLRYTALHMVPLLRQTQSAAPVSTHFSSSLVAPRLAHHHDIRLHVEHCTEHTCHIRLRTDEHSPPNTRRLVSRQPDYMVHRCWYQHRHRFRRMVIADTASPIAAITFPTKSFAVSGFWLRSLVSCSFMTPNFVILCCDPSLSVFSIARSEQRYVVLPPQPLACAKTLITP